MSCSLSCYKDAIGITNVDCACISNDRPTDYNVSKSGLYLSQLMPLPFVDAAKDCSYGDLWDMSCDSINNAELLVNADIEQKLRGKLTQVMPAYTGVIGDTSRLEVVNYNVNGNYIFQKLYFRNLRGGKVVIKKIGLHLNQSITTTIEFRDCNNDLIYSQAATTQANKLTWINLTTPLEINLSDLNSRCLFIVFDRQGSLPKMDKYHCGCGGMSYVYNESKPAWNASTKLVWNNWLMSGTGAINDINELNNVSSCNAIYNNGIFIELTANCQFNMCDENADYKGNITYFAIAQLIQHRAAINLIDKITLSNKADLLLNIDSESIAAMKKDYETKYNEILDYIISEVTNNVGSYTDCYNCYNPTGMKVSFNSAAV